MSKILEFNPAQESTIVGRILILVHKAVDEHFPTASEPSRQFTKTVFSGPTEDTAINSVPDGPPELPHQLPPPPTAGRSQLENTVIVAPPSPIREANKNAPIPEHVSTISAQQKKITTATRPLDKKSTAVPVRAAPSAGPMPSKDIGMSALADQELNKLKSRTDWSAAIAVIALLAGLALLGYVLLAQG